MITSVEELMTLVNDLDPQVRSRLRDATATSEAWLTLLGQAPDLAGIVAMNRTLPVEVLGWLVAHGDSRARHLVAMKRRLPSDLVYSLAQDPDEGVRLAVARRRGTSREVLGLLRDDPWIAVREEVDRRLSDEP